MRKQLKNWTDSGPLRVVPLEQPMARSKLKTRTVKVTKDSRTQSFYKKLSSPMGNR